MTPSNLPPDVTEGMLPGNRPKDIAFDRWAEIVTDNLDEDIINEMNEDPALDKRVEDKFFVDVDFEDMEPTVQAEKIEKFVKECLKEQEEEQ